MDSPVIIKVVSSGEKGYIGDYKGSSYPYSTYYTKKPFSDPNVQKFKLEDALKIVKTQQISSIFKLIQIIDINGKIHYDNYNNRVVYKDTNKLRDLKKVVNEEIETLLNEGYVMEHENFKFRQEIKNSSFYNYEAFSQDFDVDISESNISVNWRVAFWLNDFGIENFIVNIDSVDGTYHVALFNKQSDEKEQEYDKDIAEFQWKFEVDDAKLHKGKTLYIYSLDFDFKSKICRVTFYDPDNY